MIEGVKVKKLKVIPDERGLLMKMMRDDGECFMGEQNPILLVIPPLALHGMKGASTEPAYPIDPPTEHHVYDAPDEHRVAPHSDEVPYDWNRKDG